MASINDYRLILSFSNISEEHMANMHLQTCINLPQLSILIEINDPVHKNNVKVNKICKEDIINTILREFDISQ